MSNAPNLDAIAHVIQLSVAPVFLLTGIAGLLGLMANRLARIVDRARAIETPPSAEPPPLDSPVHAELRVLAQRARLTNRAITLGVLAALLVCAVIGLMFISAYYAWAPNVTRVVAMTFAVALLALIGALVSFLHEVYLATAALRIGPH